MRHRKAHTKLGGYTGAHQRAMYSNMLGALMEHGRIETTEGRAKALRSMAERLVTRATRLGDILLKDPSKMPAEEKARMIHAMRVARRKLRHSDAVIKLFGDVAPRFLGRPGGYTRIIKKGFRKGDGARVAYLEFIEAEMPKKEGQEAAPEKKKGLLDRLRRG